MSSDRLRVLVFGAHPDDCEFTAGGVAALYARQGHEVLFISVTNGDAGHHQMGGARLAQRRRAEAQASEMRQAQRASPQPRAIAVTGRAGLRDMSERVRACVAIGCRIGSAADADGIENNQNGARHGATTCARGYRIGRAGLSSQAGRCVGTIEGPIAA